MSTWQDIQNNPRLKKIYDKRLLITKCVREFFWSRGFVEAETPLAVRIPGQEPYLNPVAIKVNDASNGIYDLKLRTSPEFALKKLLASGYEKIFEIGKCFRDGEDIQGTHHPEFTMLEWYRAPGTLENIMDDTEEMFKNILNVLGKNKLTYRDVEVPALEKWERVSMKELFLKYLDVNLDEYLETPELKNLAKKTGYNFSETDEYEDIFFKIFLNEIEPKLGIEKPVFVYDYPARMCSLSKLSKDERYAERFELYVAGLEVANAFGELLDPVEQNKRLEVDRDLRAKLGKETWSIDPDFIAALEELHKQGITAGGVALGLDRMVILCSGAKDIREVIFNNLSD